MMELTFIGVDGGLTGAVAIFRPYESGLFRLRVLDIPFITRKISIKTRHEVDPRAFHNALMLEVGSWDEVKVLIERGVGDRRQSSSSSYNYGFTNGAVYAVLQLLCPHAEFVAPIVWKRAFGLIGKDKDASRALAQKHFPGRSWATKSSHNQAEAALIAVYAQLYAQDRPTAQALPKAPYKRPSRAKQRIQRIGTADVRGWLAQ